MESLIKSGAIYELIQKELSYLPGESAHIEMIPTRFKSSVLFNNQINNAKQSAVLCLLSKTNLSIFITLIERTIDNGPHSGQISFPGGKLETSDKNLQETALRETFEEIGIEKESIKILGKLTSLYIPVSNFHVQPYIGYQLKESELNLSAHEVKSAFKINIFDLINPANKTAQTIHNHRGESLKDTPCFLINNKTIWGATSLILNELKTIINTIKLKHT